MGEDPGRLRRRDEGQADTVTLADVDQGRMHLAKLLKSGGNVLLLDKPTNDLDVDTLRALEEALLGFAGCAVVISHDDGSSPLVVSEWVACPLSAPFFASSATPRADVA